MAGADDARGGGLRRRRHAAARLCRLRLAGAASMGAARDGAAVGSHPGQAGDGRRAHARRRGAGAGPIRGRVSRRPCPPRARGVRPLGDAPDDPFDRTGQRRGRAAAGRVRCDPRARGTGGQRGQGGPLGGIGDWPHAPGGRAERRGAARRGGVGDGPDRRRPPRHRGGRDDAERRLRWRSRCHPRRAGDAPCGRRQRQPFGRRAADGHRARRGGARSGHARLDSVPPT